MGETLGAAFEERLAEIEAYLAFLEAIEATTRSGPPRIGERGPIITTQQQRILYSGVFLLLYNLVESTIVGCVDGITDVALTTEAWKAEDLTAEFRREWVRVIAGTHKELNHENRLKSALALCDHLVASLPVNGFKVEKGGGSWDDEGIENIAARLGFNLNVSPAVYSNIKRPFRDDLGPLRLVQRLRNRLAHGSISFAECGENLTASELRDLSNRTAAYLREVVAAFTTFIETYEYIVPARRPLGARA